MTEQWQCPNCTLNNDSNVIQCIVCGSRKLRSCRNNRKRRLLPSDAPSPKRQKLDESNKNDRNKTDNTDTFDFIFEMISSLFLSYCSILTLSNLSYYAKLYNKKQYLHLIHKYIENKCDITNIEITDEWIGFDEDNFNHIGMNLKSLPNNIQYDDIINKLSKSLPKKSDIDSDIDDNDISDTSHFFEEEIEFDEPYNYDTFNGSEYGEAHEVELFKNIEKFKSIKEVFSFFIEYIDRMPSNDDLSEGFSCIFERGLDEIFNIDKLLEILDIKSIHCLNSIQVFIGSEQDDDDDDDDDNVLLLKKAYFMVLLFYQYLFYCFDFNIVGSSSYDLSVFHGWSGPHGDCDVDKEFYILPKNKKHNILHISFTFDGGQG